MEESSEAEEDNEEMNSDALIVDAECLALNGEEPSNIENGLPSSHSAEKHVIPAEKREDHFDSLGKIILLLNNKCLTFKVLLCRLAAMTSDASLLSLLSFASCSSGWIMLLHKIIRLITQNLFMIL